LLFGKYAPVMLGHSSIIKHQLTHQSLWTRFYALQMSAMPEQLGEDFQKVPVNQLERYSIPRLIDAFLEKKAGTFLFQKKLLP